MEPLLLAEVAALVDARIDSRALDRWPEGPDPALLPDLELWPGTSWRIS